MPALPRPLFVGLALLLLLGTAPDGPAQPTYKLDVKPNLKPLATLELKAGKFVRSAVRDDPGFRLQYHFKKDGKTIAVVEARAATEASPLVTAPGTYTVVLELFYPNYRGGNGPKGVYKPVSNVLTYQISAGTPPRIALVEPPKKDKPAPKR
jgi:hypothetical protein